MLGARKTRRQTLAHIKWPFYTGAGASHSVGEISRGMHKKLCMSSRMEIVVIIHDFHLQHLHHGNCTVSEILQSEIALNLTKNCLARDCSMPSKPLVLATVLNRISSTNFHHLFQGDQNESNYKTSIQSIQSLSLRIFDDFLYKAKHSSKF